MRRSTERPERFAARSTRWRDRRTLAAILIALSVLTALVYAPLLHFGFVSYDDGEYVEHNPMVAAGLTSRTVAWAFTTGHAANWHPLTWLSLMLDAQLFGAQSAGAFHLTNLLFHIVNTLLLFVLLRRLTGAIGRSAFVAAIFAIHPVHVESVAWISERKDVLSACLALLTMLAYVRYATRPSFARYLPVAGLFALGLLAKPMLVTLPFVLLLLDFWPLRRGDLTGRRWPGLALEKVPLLVLSAVSCVVTFVMQRRGGALSNLDVLPLGLRVKNALVAYNAYLGKMLWPTQLAVDYPFLMAVPFWQTTACLVLLAGMSVAVVRCAATRPYVAVGWAWYVGMLVPVIGLVQAGSQSMADRYLYLPSIGLSIAIVWAIADLASRWPIRRIALPLAATAVILACAVTARLQLSTWFNGIELWQQALRVTADDARAHGNLGVALVEASRPDEAVDEYREAIRLDPDMAEAHNNLGLALRTQGRPAEAILQFSEATRIRPDYANAHANLAMTFAGNGQTADGLREVEAALQIDPTRAEWYFAAGLMLSDEERVAEAIARFQQALTLEPNYEPARRAIAELKH